MYCKQDECEKTGLKFVGRGRITQFNELAYTAGKPHVIEIECDIWPDITYSGENGYKGLKITVTKSDVDIEKFEKVKKSILERYRILTPTDATHVAKAGDIVVVNMRVSYELGHSNLPHSTLYRTRYQQSYYQLLRHILLLHKQGYEQNDDGTKGTPLPSVASGDNVEVMMHTHLLDMFIAFIELYGLQLLHILFRFINRLPLKAASSCLD